MKTLSDLATMFGRPKEQRVTKSSALQIRWSEAEHPAREDTSFYSTLAVRERYRDDYWRNNEPIIEDRLLWRAQTFRHAVHLLPGQTILELGCGEGFFTRPVIRVTRGENPITATTFQRRGRLPPDITSQLGFLK